MRPLVMGVLNVTPDSFSDGGEHFAADSAIAHGLKLWGEGADIVDVGGESTRPGSERPSSDEELRRVLPVIRALAQEGVVLSVDTQRSEVACAAVEAGAKYINDVSGGLTDPQMLSAAAELGVTYIAQHWRGSEGKMSTEAKYDDVVAEVRGELQARADACLAAGIAPEKVILDPGLGFAKNAEHNWELLRRLDELPSYPLLIGASRKRFLAGLAGEDTRKARDAATVAVSVLTAGKTWGVRTHQVREQRAALEVWEKLRG
ncbi:MAG: dihydropteroate synthase [Propionibacteriaceae bacterium]|jgi:dihydropteroate synthase|nr:dihydropteroate synthase [Propionibacteriaceae bacterium]